MRHRILCPCPPWHCFVSQDINMYAKRQIGIRCRYFTCLFFVFFMYKPVCAVFIVEGKMIYTKKIPDMRHRILCPCPAWHCFGSQDINMYAKRQIGIRYRYLHVFFVLFMYKPVSALVNYIMLTCWYINSASISIDKS